MQIITYLDLRLSLFGLVVDMDKCEHSYTCQRQVGLLMICYCDGRLGTAPRPRCARRQELFVNSSWYRAEPALDVIGAQFASERARLPHRRSYSI